MARVVLRYVLAVSMMAVGLLHWLAPEPFVRIVPSALPAPYALVYLSGVFEVLGGAGLLWARTRTWASYGLIALYVAVFPANLNMAIHQLQISPDGDLPVWAMWARLPLQLVLIGLAYWVGRPDRKSF